MHDKCIACNKRISLTNCKNLQCKDCKKLFHPKCVRKLPPICLEKSGKFRYKIVRNKNWKCDFCTSNELPFSNVSTSTIKEMRPIQKRRFPTADELNEMFVEDSRESDDKFEFTYFSSKTQYMETRNIDSFKDESATYDDFPIISINVRSIVNRDHFTALQALLSDMPIRPAIIGLTETWVTDNTQGPYSNLKGYKFVQNHRHQYSGGGVGFYVADHLHYSVIDSMTIMKEKVFESLFINVDVNDKTIVCGTIYRKSQNCAHEGFLTNMKKVLKQCEKINKPTILMGDLNYNLLDNEDIHVSSCVDTIFDSGYYPLINIPTRITDTTGTVLDHIWTNIMDKPVKSAVLVDRIADHQPVYMNLAIDKSSSNEYVFVEKRCFSEKSIQNFNSSLCKMNIHEILQQKCTNKAYNLFIDRYSKLFEASFPIRKKKKFINKKVTRPWYTLEHTQLNDLKQENHMRHIKDKNNIVLKSLYSASRNLYFRKIKQAKREYYQKHLIDVKNDVKGTWKVINSVLGREKNRHLFKLCVNGKQIKNKTKIATEFNSYFSKVAENLVKQIPACKWRKGFNKYLKNKIQNSFMFKPTSPKEISKLLKSMAGKFSSGWDNIPQKIIKSSPYNIIFALSHIFNLSLKEGIFPDKMKIAKVIPIFKKGLKTSVENYRPISLLPVFSKLLERIVYNRLSEFLNENNVLYEKQFGFRNKHSTSHATAYLASKLYETLDEAEKSICVFMDLSKAFDTLNIDIMLDKLKHYGIRGVTNSWFSSYLSGRLQYVEIEGHRSNNLCELFHGVPQGSILGPLLFNLYINDFCNCLSFGEAIMFADDTNLVFKTKDPYYLQLMANEDLSSAADWLAENKLSLNIKKTKFMYFDMAKSNTALPKLCIGTKRIKGVETQKFLGVVFDDKLSWKPHINAVISKLNSCLGATRRARPFLNKKSMFTIYYSLMQSHVQYCCTTWASWEPRGNQVILQRLQAVCNKFFRSIYNLDQKDSVRTILKNDEVFNIYQLYNYSMGQVMHKAMHSDLPNPIQNLFDINADPELHGYFFQTKTNRLKQTEKSIFTAGPKIWNALPNSCILESDFKTFKMKLKKAILTNDH